MTKSKSSLKNAIIKSIDIIFQPITYLSAKHLKFIRNKGLNRMQQSRSVLLKVGMIPIVDHYYEPDIRLDNPKKPFEEDRYLPGFDFNDETQLQIVDKLSTHDKYDIEELCRILNPSHFDHEFQFFLPSEAECYHAFIREYKPKKIIEIGSGITSILAQKAVEINRKDGADCELTCIEPYENKWLEQEKINVIRKKVEDVELSLFESLEEGDILFIDSSHVIRPQGDVLYEYQEIIPSLKPGVLVHIHDIFTPKNYHNKWLIDKIIIWGEQYVFESFMTYNNSFKVLSATNYLWNHYPEETRILWKSREKYPNQVPSSMWIQRIK
jgi:predicted O-methyltransferase YrrM